MTPCRKVGMTVLAAGLLAWGVPSAQAAPISGSQDPAQHSTAVVLFVKVNAANGTDTLLVVNRQQRPGDVTTTGPSIQLKGNFYTRTCTKTTDINIFLTPQDVEVPGLVGSAFGVTSSGVVLLTLADNTLTGPVLFTASGVVIDTGFLAVYERQGAPLLFPHPLGPAPTWGGFDTADIDDWFVGGLTMLQMLCPGSNIGPVNATQLAVDMNAIANTLDFFAFRFDTVNTYNAAEVLKRSRHNVPCFCNSDSQQFGDFADVLTDMAAVGFGTFHWDLPTNVGFFSGGEGYMAWRGIRFGSGISWDGRLRRRPEPPGFLIP